MDHHIDWLSLGLELFLILGSIGGATFSAFCIAIMVRHHSTTGGKS
jgi:hypothetical protein